MKKGKILRITLLSVKVLLCFHGALCYKAPVDQWLEKRGLLVARLRLRKYSCSTTHYLLGLHDSGMHVQVVTLPLS